MTLPMARIGTPETVRRSGVIFPNGTCFAVDDVKRKKEKDVSFWLEIESLQESGIEGLTERQRAQLVVALEQAHRDVLERLGVKNHAGVKKGDVVRVYLPQSEYVGVVARVTRNVLSILSFMRGSGELVLVELPRNVAVVEVVPRCVGIEGLASAALFSENFWPDRTPDFQVGVQLAAVKYLTNQGDLERLAKTDKGDISIMAISLLTDWTILFSILMTEQEGKGRDEYEKAAYDTLERLIKTLDGEATRALRPLVRDIKGNEALFKAIETRLLELA